MPDKIAECLVRLVASREQASTIMGDLGELSITRGRVWFWLAIARTVLSLLWRDLKSEPWFLMGLGLRGLLVTICLGSLIGFITFGLSAAFLDIVHLRRAPIGYVFIAVSLLITALVQLITGLYLAKKSRGREIAAVIAYVGVYNAMRLVGVIISAPPKVTLSFRDVAHAVTAGAFGNGHVDQIAVFLKFAPLFLAAILARFRQRESLSSVVRL